MPRYAMVPDWRLLADGADITARMRDRLLRLTLTDEAGIASDTLEVELDNRDGALALPRTGAELSLSLGWAGQGLTPMGLFTVDEVRSSGPVRTLTIAAKAADVRASYKAPRTRSWHDTTLGDLVRSVAGSHGLVPAVAPGLASIPVPHLDQTAESDMALLTRLARDHDAVAKPANGRLVFVPRGEAKTVSGRSLPPASLSPEDGITSWTATLSDRGRYGAVTAHWHDPSTAERRSVTVGGDEPTLTLPHAFPTEDAARRAAAAKLAALSRGTARLRLTCPADLTLAAEVRLTVSGLDAAADGTWTITKATHTLSGAGFTTEIEAEGVGDV
ncbi:contractile injection system protein, VgrG/Pvc8 family [Rhodocista pekingensis]|uniref:Contractile injection system protein, VgrG/Pvc8 family n=1 Tax=Rhodocista pekingensis TaxID=201185 RepID=A0ABW2KRV5_9PROT